MTVTLFCHWSFWVGNAWLINYAQVRGQRIWSWKKNVNKFHANTLKLVWLASARLDDLSLHNFLIELLTCLKGV